MIDKRPRTPREAAAFSLFSMAEEGAWSDGALHYYLGRAGLGQPRRALASRLVYGTVQNELLLDFRYLRHFPACGSKKSRRVYSRACAWAVPADFDGQDPGARRGRGDGRACAAILPRKRPHGLIRQRGDAQGRAGRGQGKLPVLDCPDKESYYSLRYSHPEWLVRLV